MKNEELKLSLKVREENEKAFPHTREGFSMTHSSFFIPH